MEMHSSLIKHTQNNNTALVTGLSIPSRNNDHESSRGVSQPMLIGLISGAALTLCVVNLITFMLNFLVVAFLALLLLQPEGLKSIREHDVLKKLASTYIGRLLPVPRNSSIEQSKDTSGYRPFEAEVEMIMDVVEEFENEEIYTSSTYDEMRVLKFVQETVVTETHIIEYEEMCAVQDTMLEDDRFERFIEEDVDEEDAPCFKDTLLLLEKNLGCFSAEDYTEEIHNLYQHRFESTASLLETVS